VRPSNRKAEDAPRVSAGRDIRRPRRGWRSEAGGIENFMATPEIAVPPLSPKELTKQEQALKEIGSDYAERFGFHDPETGYAYKAPKGLNREIVESISEYKSEPQWMREFRLKALDHFENRPTPTWGGDLSRFAWNNIHY